MFEAVVALCLMADPKQCRDVLLPGFEAATQVECASGLGASMPDIALLFPDLRADVPRCVARAKTSDITQISAGVFAHRATISDATTANYGDVGNNGFVIGEQAIAVIDTGGSRKAGEELYRAIRARSALPIRYVILTHMHPDHVLGASVFVDAGAQVVGHVKLQRALADRAETYLANFERLIGEAQFIGTRVHVPEIAVETQAVLDLGNRPLHLRAWPTAHTGADLTVGDPASGVLFTGDLMFHQHAPALDGAILGWQQVLTDLKVLPFAHIVPGHGGPILDWPDAAAALEHYLDVLTADTRAAIAHGDSLGEAIETVAESEADKWDLFDLFNPRNATVAYTELEWE